MFSKLQPKLRSTTFTLRKISQNLKAFATVDPVTMGENDKGQNLVKGTWQGTKNYTHLPDPLTGKVMMKVPDTSLEEIAPFIESL